MPCFSGGFWKRPSGDVSSVTGLWRCGGFGGTAEEDRGKVRASETIFDAGICSVVFFSLGDVLLQYPFLPKGGGISYPN